jgi:acyl carrier protein
MKEKIIEVIYKSINELNEQLVDKQQLVLSTETALYGSDGSLDSLDFINLIVAVEQKIEDELNIGITLADERAMSQEHSPFSTVGSLRDYIEMLLEEKLHD